MESLLSSSRSIRVREADGDPCPSCRRFNEAEAAECRYCGASLVFAEVRGPRSFRTSSDSFWSPEGAPPVEEALDYGPGEIFAGRYVVIDRLGQGGMGVVYKARDRELGRTVALKMIRGNLSGDPETLSRFRREPGLAQQVTHENVCRVHDLGIHEGVRYLSMEYLEADTLSGLLRRIGSLSVKQALSIGLQVASGLEAIHARGIVHRDLKPSNVAIDREGRVAVMDFGLARGPVDSEVTRPGVLVGSYAYLAPEHIRGEPLTAAADVYALGLVLYELLTGLRPPGDSDQRPLALRGEGAPLPAPSAHHLDVPAALDDLVLRCLSWKPEDRPDVGVVREELSRLLEEERLRAIPLRGPELRARGGFRAALAAGLVAAAALAFALSFYDPKAEPTSIALVPFEGEEVVSRLSEDGLAVGLRAVDGIRVTVVEPDLRGKPDEAIRNALGAEWLLRGKTVRDERGTRWLPELSSPKGVVSLGEAESLDRARERILEELGFSTDSPTIASLRTANPDAYRIYLEARSHHDGWFAEGDVERARSLYREALKLDSGFAAAQAGLALASAGYFVSTKDPGDLAVARYASDRALAMDFGQPEAHLARATILATEGSWKEARQAFERAFELSPGNYASRRNVADLYETLGRNQDADEIYRRLIADQPLDWSNHYWYGGFLYRTGSLKAAEASLERARDLAPEAEGPVAILGFCRLASGDLAGAKREFEHALELEPGPRARKRLGLVHYYSGEFQEALEQWSLVLEGEGEDASAHTDVADALRQLGRAEEADGHYRRALELYETAIPSDEILAQRAQVLAAIGRCAEARDQMTPLLAKEDPNPAFLYYAALAAGRCRLDDWAAELVLKSIGSGNVVGIWFDPDLERVRSDPRIRRPLELIGTPN